MGEIERSETLHRAKGYTGFVLPVVRGSTRQSAQEVLRHVMEEADRLMEVGSLTTT